MSNNKYFIHKLADVQTINLGEGTKIWQFSVVLPEVVIGKNCNICSHTFIENNVTLGDNVTIKNGVQLWDGVLIEDNVFIGPNVTFTNDIFPRSKEHPDSYEKTIVEKNASIGGGVTILPGVTIGQNSMIGAGSVVTKDVEAFSVVVGNPAKVIRRINEKNKSDGNDIHQSVFIDKNVIIEDKVVIRANCSLLSNDSIDGVERDTVVKSGAEMGAGSTIYPGVTIGAKAVVMGGSVVTRSVPPLAIVQGNPAAIVGYKSTRAQNKLNRTIKPKGEVRLEQSTVNAVTMHHLPLISDLRGDLSVGEFENHVPFFAKRYFLVFSVPTAETRGEHAHKVCEQFLICVKGSCKVIADDGRNREEFILDEPNKGVYLPAMTWGIQYQYSPDAVLLVFASEYYDANDYIRDYDEFLILTN